MKKITVTIIISILFISANAQNLSLKDLISFVNKDVSEINTDLIKQKWDYLGDQKINDSTNVFKWAHNFNEIDSTADSWMSAIEMNIYSNIIIYQCSKLRFTGFLKELEKLGVKKSNSRVTDGDILTRYIGKTHSYDLTTGKDRRYTIKISDRVSERRKLIDDILNNN